MEAFHGLIAFHLTRTNDMGKKELFNERRRPRNKRRKEYKSPHTDSFLIVTEGTKTEPNYFKGLRNQILEKTHGKIDVVPVIEVRGEGKNTESLVDAAAELNRNADIIYQHVWVVMDKDDFPRFDQAIAKAKSMGFNVAWSNQSFEYWIYLHYYYSDVAMHRDDINKKLNQIFKNNGVGGGKYKKEDEKIFDVVNEPPGNTMTAIANAKRRMAKFDLNQTSPSKIDPGTTVHLLVEQLLSYV